MRLIGLISLMGLSLASCSSSDSEQLTGGVEEKELLTPIRFASGLYEEQSVTRAGESLSEYATSFRVWAYKDMSYDEGTAVFGGGQTVIGGYTVNWHANSAATTTSNSDNWEYVGEAPNQTIKYWDWSAKAYRFFAATKWKEESAGPYEANGTYGANGTYESGEPSETYETYKITLLADASSDDEMDATPYFSRLWFSTGKQPEYADKLFGKPVTLEFLKPFARVRFIFKYVFPREGISLTDKTFKPTDDYDADEPTGIALKSTVTVNYPLTGPATQEWYTIEPKEVSAAEDTIQAFTEDYDPENDSKVYTKTDNGWYIVAANNTQGSYKLTAKVNGESKSAVVPEEYMQWLPGYSYTYVFKITDEGGIEIGWVESAVTPWTEMEMDRTVYNW